MKWLMLEYKIFTKIEFPEENNFRRKRWLDGYLILAQAEWMQLGQTPQGFEIVSFLTTREI